MTRGEYEKSPGAPCKKARCPGASSLSAVVAVAGKQNDGNDDQPKGAVVKKIAKTVIHNCSSQKITEERYVCSSATILWRKKKNVQEFRRGKENSAPFCCWGEDFMILSTKWRKNCTKIQKSIDKSHKSCYNILSIIVSRMCAYA